MPDETVTEQTPKPPAKVEVKESPLKAGEPDVMVSVRWPLDRLVHHVTGVADITTTPIDVTFANTATVRTAASTVGVSLVEVSL